MTDRELLDAIRSGLEETSRRFAKQPSAKGEAEQTRSAAERDDVTAGRESSDAERAKTKP